MDADTIMRRLHELEEENKRLRSLLAEHGIPFEACVHDGNLAVPQYSKLTSSSVSLSLQEKVGLFQSLFKGREDVFAKRWHSETTKKSTLAVSFVQTLMTRVASMGIRMMFLPLLVYARNGEFLAI